MAAAHVAMHSVCTAKRARSSREEMSPLKNSFQCQSSVTG